MKNGRYSDAQIMTVLKAKTAAVPNTVGASVELAAG